MRLPWRRKDRGGYTIHRSGRAASVEYRDEFGSAFVDVEMAVGPDIDLIFYSDQVYADRSSGTLVPDPARRALIAERTRRALEADGYKLDVV